MGDVSIRDLRHHGVEIVERAEAGEDVTITRAGTPVAQLRALPRQPLTAEALLSRWRQVPAVDAAALRADLDTLLHPRL